MVTPKQTQFAASVIAGCSLSDAYRKAYDVGRMSAKHVHEEASRLRKNPKVARIIEEGMKDVMAQAAWNRKTAIEQAAQVAGILFARIIEDGTDADAIQSYLKTAERLDVLSDIEFEKSLRHRVYEKASSSFGFIEDTDVEAGIRALKEYDDKEWE